MLEKRAVKRYSQDLSAGGRTKQSEREVCDINKIVAKARQTGFVNSVNSKPGVYADVSDVPDYQTALEIVNKADAEFMALPAKVRDRFNNDPAEMISFIMEEGNYAEGEKLGLFKKKDAIDPQEGTVPPAGSAAVGSGS